MNKAESRYLGRMVRLGCILCRHLYPDYIPPDPSLQLTVIHHLREGEGGAQRAPNWGTVPLCVPHHAGKHGIHGDRLDLLPVKADEMDLLFWTIEAMNS